MVMDIINSSRNDRSKNLYLFFASVNFLLIFVLAHTACANEVEEGLINPSIPFLETGALSCTPVPSSSMGVEFAEIFMTDMGKKEPWLYRNFPEADRGIKVSDCGVAWTVLISSAPTKKGSIQFSTSVLFFFTKIPEEVGRFLDGDSAALDMYGFIPI